MASVRPFQFTNLPRLRREQVAFHESLATYLSYRPFAADFAGSLAQIIAQLLKVPCQFAEPELRSLDADGIAALLPAVACVAVVGIAPGEHKILVDLDSGLAHMAIE